MQFLRYATISLLAAIIAFAGGYYANSPEPLPPATTLQCNFPTEDSCIPDYIGNGEWILIKTLP